MRRQSKRRAALVRIYTKRRAEYLFAHPWCLRCGGEADQIHHRAGRVGAALLDETRWASVCDGCHRYITEHPAEAIEAGWSLPRIGRSA